MLIGRYMASIGNQIIVIGKYMDFMGKYLDFHKKVHGISYDTEEILHHLGWLRAYK